MTFPRLEHLDVRHMTSHQPFYAGVILLQHGRLVVTLNEDGLPSTLKNTPAYRIGGVGGGQEAGETIWQCAMREAREELCTDIQLLGSSITYFHDIDTGEVYPVGCQDVPAPFLLERQSNLYPYTPYRPGLPSGPYTYFGLFLAQTVQPLVQPGDDVLGLLQLPLDLWPRLHQQISLGSLLQEGAQLMERTRLPRESLLWLHPNESFDTVVTLLRRHPHLLND